MNDATAVYYPARPRTPARPALSSEIPESYRERVRVASAVLPDSPESSAALSRRGLQELLIEKGDVKPADSLAAQIETVLDRGDIPRHLGEQLDGIPAIGNFAAHPIKSTATGTVMEVALG